MRINSINSIQYTTKVPSFKHTAVPYPEYENLISKNDNKTQGIAGFINKLFHPEITLKAGEIKSEINEIYDNSMKQEKDPDKHLLSVFA